jgi:hypothetical protein
MFLDSREGNRFWAYWYKILCKFYMLLTSSRIQFQFVIGASKCLKFATFFKGSVRNFYIMILACIEVIKGNKTWLQNVGS